VRGLGALTGTRIIATHLERHFSMIFFLQFLSFFILLHLRFWSFDVLHPSHVKILVIKLPPPQQPRAAAPFPRFIHSLNTTFHSPLPLQAHLHHAPLPFNCW
jgi:hypothetical protein